MVPQTTIQEFLRILAQTNNITGAAREAGISQAVIYEWRKNSPKFVEAMAAAKVEYHDILRAAAHRRGVDGVLKPIYQGGKLMGFERKFSDGLLRAALQAIVPEFKEDAPTVAVQANVLITPAIPKDADEWEKIADAAEE